MTDMSRSTRNSSEGAHSKNQQRRQYDASAELRSSASGATQHSRQQSSGNTSTWRGASWDSSLYGNNDRAASSRTTGATDTRSTKASTYYSAHSRTSGLYEQPATASRAGGQQTGTSPRTRKRRKRAIILGIVALLIVGIAVEGVTLYRSVQDIRNDVATLKSQVNDAKTEYANKDYLGISVTVLDVKDTAVHLRETLSGAQFTIASLVPVVGSDIRHGRTALDAVIAVIDDAAAPATETLAIYPPSTLFADGNINMEAANALMDAVTSAAPAVASCTETMNGIGSFHLSKIQNTFGPLLEQLNQVNDVIQLADTYIPAVRLVLGDDGNRTFLIAAQNSAEMRATGGFPGAIGLLVISSGRISLQNFGTCYSQLASYTTADMAITSTEMTVSRGEMQYPRDAGYLPDFTRAASIWAKAYLYQTGRSVDGVISLTPAVVQYLLEAVGSITLEDGTVLDGTNATKVLEHDLYWTYMRNPEDGYADYVDALFVQAASRAFQKLTQELHVSSAVTFARGLMECIDNREAMLWLTNEGEQAELESIMDCSGTINTDAKHPAVGVFFNTYLPSKTAWWLDQTTTIGKAKRNADGTTSYEVTSTFTNNITPEEASEGGQYIMAHADWYGRMAPIIELVAPAGGSITDIQTSGDATFESLDYEGNELWYNSNVMTISPGETFTITCTVTVSSAAEEALTFYSQPTLTEYRNAAE